MRKKMTFLALALALTAGAFTASRAAAGGTHACQFGCRSCICDASGIPIACTNVYCNPQ